MRLHIPLALVSLFTSVTAIAARAQDPADRRPTLAVMYFNNGALVDRASYDALSKGIADILITDLAANDRVRVVERDQLQKLLDEQDLTVKGRVEDATAVRVGKLLGAGHMIVGGFFVDRSGTLRLDARAVNVETSRIEHVESVTGKSENILGVIGELSGKLTKGLKLGDAPPSRPQGDAPKGGRFQSVMLYSQAMILDDDKKVGGAAQLYRQFLDETPPTFLVPEHRKAEARLKALKGGS
jgi:TolB-like protein